MHRGDRFAVEPGFLRELRALVHRAQRVDGGAQAGGETFVREVLVGEHGVAAVRRDLACEQQRERGWRGQVRGVGVPGGGDRRGVGDAHHAGVAVDRRHVGMDRDLTPSASRTRAGLRAGCPPGRGCRSRGSRRTLRGRSANVASSTRSREVDAGDDRAERPCFAGDGDAGTNRARQRNPFPYVHIRYRT